MQARNFWAMVAFTAGFEVATFITWMSNADPKLTKKLFVLSLIAEIYLFPKTCSFFYKTSKESKDFFDFNIKLDAPIISDLYENLRKN